MDTIQHIINFLIQVSQYNPNNNKNVIFPIKVDSRPPPEYKKALDVPEWQRFSFWVANDGEYFNQYYGWFNSGPTGRCIYASDAHEGFNRKEARPYIAQPCCVLIAKEIDNELWYLTCYYKCWKFASQTHSFVFEGIVNINESGCTLSNLFINETLKDVKCSLPDNCPLQTFFKLVENEFPGILERLKAQKNRSEVLYKQRTKLEEDLKAFFITNQKRQEIQAQINSINSEKENLYWSNEESEFAKIFLRYLVGVEIQLPEGEPRYISRLKIDILEITKQIDDLISRHQDLLKKLDADYQEQLKTLQAQKEEREQTLQKALSTIIT